MSEPADQYVGRARAVLVYGDSESPQGVVCWLQALAEPASDEASPTVTVEGPVSVEAAAQQQLETVVAPLVNRLLQAIGLPACRYRISVANIDASAAHDLPATISGYSADLPAFLAMLSAALRVTVDPTVVATGHIASMGGEIAPVRALGAKWRAASQTSGVTRFLHPRLDRDGSLAALSPQRARDEAVSMASAGLDIQAESIGGIDELLTETISESDVVLASLEAGFFDQPAESTATEGPFASAVSWLSSGNPHRFWRILEAHAFEGRSEEIKSLLRQMIGFYLREGRYPDGMGAKLEGLLLSLPSAVRRLRLRFPLVDPSRCAAMGQFAASDDAADDLRRLMNAVTGCLPQQQRYGDQTRSGSASSDERGAGHEAVVATVVDRISADALTRGIGEPIDRALAGFTLPYVTCQRHEDFIETVQSFYRQVIRHTAFGSAPLDSEHLSAEAFDLLERAFRDQDGARGAQAEARHGTRGGLRFVLERMADQLKQERTRAHVNRVLREAVDILDPDARIGFMRALMTRLRPHLPADVRDQPPEYFAGDYETLTQAYMRAIDGLAERFRVYNG
jgi:hypothetical protein